MKVGILDLLSMPSTHWLQIPYRALLNKQYAAIMPQAIAVWCRQMGHETYYATYYGQGDPLHALPDELDVVFVSSFTHVSPLAYALAKAYHEQGALTVIGGPHARSFPEDCQRFFDLVVKECDKELVADILAGSFDRGSQISGGGSLADLPTVEERWPEIKRAAFWRGKPYFASTVPLLASTGCPYHCDFCIDWSSKYRPLPPHRLQADLAFLAEHHPRMRITFHDPNLAVGWDPVLEELERIPPERRSPTVVESSLASLKGESRLKRIRDTRCQFICVGIESWSGYSEKAGAGHVQGLAKVPLVVDRLREVAGYVPYLQGSFVFGLDSDQGEEPVEATKEFISSAPFVWPVINIPQPFGQTPLYNDLLRDERLLTTMPFYFYQMPFLVTSRALRPHGLLREGDRSPRPRHHARDAAAPAGDDPRPAGAGTPYRPHLDGAADGQSLPQDPGDLEAEPPGRRLPPPRHRRPARGLRADAATRAGPVQRTAHPRRPDAPGAAIGLSQGVAIRPAAAPRAGGRERDPARRPPRATRVDIVEPPVAAFVTTSVHQPAGAGRMVWRSTPSVLLSKLATVRPAGS